MDLNKEDVLQQLQNFAERGSAGNEKIPEALDEYLKFVAKTGDVLFPWSNVKPLLRRKVEIVLDEFHENHPLPAAASATQPFNFSELKKEILMSLESFTGAPFTIQRICELLTLPTKHYKRTDKFMRGLEKNVLVVSHIDPKLSASSDRPPTPPKSIFAPDTSFHVFERSLNLSEMSGSPSAGPSSSSSSNVSIEDSFRSRDAFLVTDQPGTSSSSSGASSSKILLPSLSCPNPQTPAPLQQLDSFTTVFSSPPSTPLAVVSNMPPFEPTSSSSSSSSSGSSDASSPQPDGEPSSPPENPEGHSFDSRSSFTSSESNHSNPSQGDVEPSPPAEQQPPQPVVLPQEDLPTAAAESLVPAASIPEDKVSASEEQPVAAAELESPVQITALSHENGTVDAVKAEPQPAVSPQQSPATSNPADEPSPTV